MWRYLVDLDGLETVYRAAKDASNVILACPAVLYEMLRLQDTHLRHRLVKAICRTRWVRMMPEAFEECDDLRTEIARIRPHWLRQYPDRASYSALYNDWAGSRGVWWRARTDPAHAAAILRSIEGDRIARARTEAREQRDELGKLTTFDKVTLDRWTTTFPLSPPGWDGNPVATWRASTLTYYIDALLVLDPDESAAVREWLEPWVDLVAIRRDLPSLTKLFLHETGIERLPRNWLRWAFRTLQATRKTTLGTPVDNQISSYLVDADVLVTADKAFAAIVQRIAGEDVIRVASPTLVSPDTCTQTLTSLLRQAPRSVT